MSNRSPKSPFPGMDPFMELRWQDVHSRLIPAIGDQLQEQLPGDLLAQINERVLMEVSTDEVEVGGPQSTYPDVRVTESRIALLNAVPAVAQEGAAPDGIIYEELAYPEREVLSRSSTPRPARGSSQ